MNKLFHKVEAQRNAYKTFDLIALLVIVAFFISGVLTLPNYGLTWDESLGDAFFGERYIYYFRSLNVNYLDFSAHFPALDSLPLYLSTSSMISQPWQYPPLSGELGALSMHVFSYHLHWLDPVDGFHLATIVLAAVLLWALYRFFSRQLTPPVALLGIILLGFFPRLWGDMHFNGKDVSEVVFYSLTLLAYAVYDEKPSWSRALVVGILGGAALAVKANIVFAPFIIAAGVWRWDLHPRQWLKDWQPVKSFIIQHAIMLVAALHVFFLTWPYLWGADFHKLWNYITYIRTQGYRTSSPGWDFTPLRLVITTMPEIMLAFLLVGLGFIFYLFFKKEPGVMRFLLAWLLVPVIRICMPGAENFDGIRHFLEFAPAAAMIAAYGAGQIVRIIPWPKSHSRAWLGTAVLGLVIANLVWINTQYFPYDYLYFNSLIGGFPHAEAQFGSNEATDYWGSTYRAGMSWLKAHAAQGAVLYSPVANDISLITGRIWLRTDMSVLPASRSDQVYKTDRPVYVMFITRPGFYDDVADYCVKNLKPVYEIKLQGVPLMQIYRYSPPPAP